MSETSLRANSCIELSEIKKLDSLLRQCETLSYDDLSSSSNGDHELADYMEPKGRLKRRNSSVNLITTPPITKTAIRALSNLNIFNGAKKIMRMVNENSSYYDRNCLLPQKSHESYKTKSCSSLQKPMCFGNQNKLIDPSGGDHFFSISENILSTTADKATVATPVEVDCRECECHCPLPSLPEPSTTIDSGLPNQNANAPSQKAIRKRRPTEKQSNNHHHHHHNHYSQHPTSKDSNSSSHVTSPTAAGFRPYKSDNTAAYLQKQQQHRKLDVEDENRIVNINETPNIVPISLNSVNHSSSYEGMAVMEDDAGIGVGPHRASIRHQKSLDNKSDKSQVSQANSQKSRSKFSPQYLSRKISHKTTSGAGMGGESEAGGEGGAKESLLGHKFEKILPEPVETVSTTCLECLARNRTNKYRHHPRHT